MTRRLPRTARLLKAADFSASRDRRWRLTTHSLVAEYWTTEASDARLGMAVSRRVSKRAVVRNRIRRQIRESFRLHRHELAPLDILVIARARAAQVENAALRADLESLWRRLREPPSSAALKPDRTNGTMRADS